jgi:hypothetical protein
MILAKHLLPFRLRKPEPPLPVEDVDLSGLDDEDVTAVVSLADVEAMRAEARKQHVAQLRGRQR